MHSLKRSPHSAGSVGCGPWWGLAWTDTGDHTKAIDHGASLGIDVEFVHRDPGRKGFKVIPRRCVVEQTFAGSCATTASPATTKPCLSEPKRGSASW